MAVQFDRLIHFLRGIMNRCFFAVILTLGIALPASLLCSSATLAEQSPSSKAYTPANVKAGNDVFLEKCFQCHSVNPGEVRVGPSLFGVMKGPHARTAAQVRVQITDGKGKMPPFKDLLKPEQVDQLVAYLHSLQ
jgi:mono/diheme cytochrome c family protein